MVERLLDHARGQIQPSDQELEEARARRSKLSGALRDAFPGSRTYFNGSFAHGDAITPLNDLDIGVVVKGAEQRYGPGLRGPRDLMERARDGVRDHMADEFPKLTVTIEGQRRAVLVRFGAPVTPGQPDFTADIITAVDHLDGRGLFIPNLPANGWDPSDPEAHLRLVLEAIKDTNSVFARVVRLLKYWNRRHGKPLCSWNIKALALGCVTEPMPQAAAMETFFRAAAEALADGPTPDPADVAGDIKLNLSKTEVISRLQTAERHMVRAREHEDAGRHASAQHELAMVLPDIVPDADPTRVAEEEAARLRSATAAGLSIGVGAGSGLILPKARAWAPH